MDRWRLFLLVLFVAGAVAAAWLLIPPANTPVANAMNDAAAVLPDEGEPLALPAKNTESGKTLELTGTAEADTGATVDTPDRESAETGAAPHAGFDEALHVPIYGAAVRRSGALATFKLTDARDQPLHDADADVDLWRRVGARWIPDEAYWDAEKQLILCDGLSGKGLEPGEYELEVRTNSYGAFRHTFRISKGEQLDGHLRTQTWRRIICFDFKRPDGKPLEWIKSSPGVSTTLEKLEPAERLFAPEDVLREPPTPSSGGRGGKGGFAYRRARGGSGRAMNFKTATDEGRVYVPVIAGAENVVTFDFDPVWGTEGLTFEGQFTGPEWEKHEVVMTLAEGFDETTAEWSQYGTSDPGDRGHLSWIERLLNPPALDDLTSFDRCRLIIELEGPEGRYVNFTYQAKDAEKANASRQMNSRGNFWYANGQPGGTVRFTLMLGECRFAEPEAFVFPEDSTERVFRLRRSYSAKPVVSPDWKFTPTVDAWAVHRSLVVTSPDAAEPLAQWPLSVDGEHYLLPATLANQLGRSDATRVAISWQVSPAGFRNGFSYAYDIRREVWAPNHWSKSNQSLYSEEYAPGHAHDLLTTGSAAPPAPRGFALRVIGPQLEGLPWAEASIVEYTDDARANRLREVETSLHAAGKRPNLATEFADDYYDNEEAFGDENIAASMEKWVGKEFLEQAADPADLAYYAKRGAWYNTHHKLKSDALGYVIELERGLTPGKVYVLYLWSDSRDDLRPDARIVFKATEGCTDLGAISLPSYSR